MTKYQRFWNGTDVIYEHRAVYEKHFGPIPKGYHIHHKNGDMFDNQPENLEAIRPVDHSRTHFKRYRRDETGEWLKTCHTCGVEKPLSEFYKMGKSSHRRDCKPCQHETIKVFKNLKSAAPVAA